MSPRILCKHEQPLYVAIENAYSNVTRQDMKQLTLAAASGFEKHNRATRKAAFLARMEALVPWSEFCALIEPHYPKVGWWPPADWH